MHAIEGDEASAQTTRGDEPSMLTTEGDEQSPGSDQLRPRSLPLPIVRRHPGQAEFTCSCCIRTWSAP